MATQSPLFPRLQIARLEGRAQSTLFRQAQFRRLYKTLRTSASAIKLAIQSDSGHLPTEVEFEFTLALLELRDLYNSLNLTQDLDSQQRVTKGQDNVERTKPVGIVYIVPARWSLFYSAIAPLGAALAAGNCVILELPQTLGNVSSIVRKLLTEALDADVFAISTSRPTAKDFTSQCTLVFQDTEDVDQSKWFQTLQPPQHAGSIVVVDRTADIAKSAEMISNASFAFRGGSRYSPRMVLANEYICDRLLSALAALVVNSRPGSKSDLTGAKSDAGPLHTRRQKDTTLTKKANIKEIALGSNGNVVELVNPLDPVLLTEAEGPVIIVRRIGSLDDAINMVAHFGTFAACYAFGGAAEANYISTYIDSHLSTINHIPAELLIGPVAPAHPSKSAAPSPRYSPSLFTVPRPQYLQSPSSLPLSILGQNYDASELKKWTEVVMTPLVEVARPNRILLNFFGTGIMLGLSTIAVSAIGTSTGIGWFLYKTYRAW